MEKKCISIIVPLFNEQENIGPIYQELCVLFRKLDHYHHEFIFIDDGSTDLSYIKLQELAAKDKRVKAISFSRNFGNQVAVSAGMKVSQGDALITIDCDLQHPINLIPELISKWEEGAEIVLTKRLNKKDNILSKLFFFILTKFTDLHIDSTLSDFRLLDKKVANILNTFTEKRRFMRAMLDWTGFKKDYATFKVKKRNAGKSSFSLNKLFKLGVDAITSFTLFPLKLAFILGTLIFCSSSILLVIMFIYKFINPVMFTNAAYFIVLNAVLSGLILICLGIVAHYIGNIHNEVLNRPLFIVRDQINIETDNISKLSLPNVS